MADAATARDPALQELLDKQAIREVVMRYCRGADRCDADLIASAFHPDGTEDRMGVVHRGDTIGSEIAAGLRESMQSTNHQVTTQLISVSGDAAASESYSTGNHVMKDGRRLHTLVRYLDRFERRDGEWKIIERRVITDDMDLRPPAGSEQLGPPSAATRDPTDPSYALFRG